MVRRAFRALLGVLICLAPVLMHSQGEYLDVYIAHVKLDKVADFTALAKKVVDANRRNNGDHWLAQSVQFGEGYTYAFVSWRQDYAEIDKATDAFMNAVDKAYGKENAEKIFHEWDSCLVSSRTELRKRRPDLSRKVPNDMTAYANLVGTSRVLRTTTVHIRPGRAADFEALLKDAQAAGEKLDTTQPLMVSQAVEGTQGTTYYITALRRGMDGFDKNPTMHEILGDDGYKKYLQGISDTVETAESMVLRFAPDLSNPPESVVAAAPDFWQPKTVVAMKAKPKSLGDKATAEKPKQ
jgi:hypothetical protein